MFAFVPRKVAKAVKPTHHGASTSKADTVTIPEILPSRDKGKGKETTSAKSTFSAEDYANLVCLAFSNHALWSDPDLRRTIDFSTTDDNNGPDAEGQGRGEENEGFIALSYILRRSPITSGLRLLDSQTAIVKAVRSYAADIFDVRLLVTEPSSSAWVRGGHAVRTKDPGGYEIRRKAYAGELLKYSRDDWEKRTLYFENIPAHYRSISGIARFTLALLAGAQNPEATPGTTRTRIQNITLPPHHQDKPGDSPSCKGFALVTFAHLEDTEWLLQTWPWKRNAVTNITSSDSHESSVDATDASKFGFRTLTKGRWEQLKHEYLAYRQRLIDEINASEDANESSIPAPSHSLGSNTASASSPHKSSTFTSTHHTSQAAPALPSPPFTNTANTTTQPPPDSVPTATPTITPASPYPYHCLVFVRHIHPETNKTTLRALFATAFKAHHGAVQGDGLDYVDFTKSMDSCHLRLSTPSHAHLLVEHFRANPTAQTHGLDGTGSPPAPGSPPAISMDVVLGTREGLYWQKVPEKVRRQAVQKAISLGAASGAGMKAGGGVVDWGGEGGGEDGDGDGDGDGEGRKRKRRKR